MAARRHIVPIFIPHWGCPYLCVYCDQRVIADNKGPLDIAVELAYALQKVPPEAHPIEVAFYGGTFTALPLNLQEELLKAVRPYLDTGRVDSIRISTHPACISDNSLALLNRSGVSIVELGVQSMDPEVLRLAGRGYGPTTVEDAVKKLKEKGFQVGVQLMPGLPGDTKGTTLNTVRQVIALKPDFVRVYPTVVIAGTPLARLWQEGKYHALNLAEAVEWCKEISKLFTQAHVPIIRMGLNPSQELEGQVLAGPYHPAFKALVDSAMVLEQIEQHLPGSGSQLIIYANPRNISVIRGHKNHNIRILREKYGFTDIKVLPDKNLTQGQFIVK